jgi:hypothetical protein
VGQGQGLGARTARDKGPSQRQSESGTLLNSPGKIQLSDNHRLAASVLFRGTERACDSALEWLDKPSTQMNELRDDVTAEEKAELRKLAAALRQEIEKLESKVQLDRSHSSRRRSIAALLSAALIDLQETQDSQLKGYGVLSPEAKKVLNDSIARMSAALQKMLAIAEARP